MYRKNLLLSGYFFYACTTYTIEVHVREENVLISKRLRAVKTLKFLINSLKTRFELNFSKLTLIIQVNLNQFRTLIININ